ncbi:MAG: VOC family protein [Candidatus Micrarchaeota archaeon]|nr:VOC family protein [Candidatus Micrarchaeota archaeon]
MDKVVHFEIPAKDVERARKFYRDTFDWKVKPMPEMDYTIVRTMKMDEDADEPPKEYGINGGIMKATKEVKAPVIYMGVEDIDEALKRIERNGGKAMGEKQKVSDMGWSAYAKDSEGNVIGLWQNAEDM